MESMDSGNRHRVSRPRCALSCSTQAAQSLVDDVWRTALQNSQPNRHGHRLFCGDDTDCITHEIIRPTKFELRLRARQRQLLDIPNHSPRSQVHARSVLSLLLQCALCAKPAHCASQLIEEPYLVVYQRIIRLSAREKKILVGADFARHELIGCPHRVGTRQRDRSFHLHLVLT